jgi:hypothetical protein
MAKTSTTEVAVCPLKACHFPREDFKTTKKRREGFKRKESGAFCSESTHQRSGALLGAPVGGDAELGGGIWRIKLFHERFPELDVVILAKLRAIHKFFY